jgi:hypothetical protein
MDCLGIWDYPCGPEEFNKVVKNKYCLPRVDGWKLVEVDGWSPINLWVDGPKLSFLFCGLKYEEEEEIRGNYFLTSVGSEKL